MTKVEFETATLADCIERAAKVAAKPSGKGGQALAYAGLKLEVDPANDFVLVRATDQDIFFSEWVDVVDIEGLAATWLLPSKQFAAFMTGLPIGSGRNVVITQDGNACHLVAGKTRAKLQMLDHSNYVAWPDFEQDSMSDAPTLGAKLSAVGWAVHKDEVALSGVHLDGTHAIGTDKYRLARMPLAIADMESGITIPPRILGQVLKDTGDTKIKVQGHSLLVSPDEHSQVRMRIIDLPFPKASAIYNRVYDHTVELDKDAFLASINRASAIDNGSPFPCMKIFIGEGELACFMSDDTTGHIGDIIEIPGQAAHKRQQIVIGPNFLKEAISHVVGKKVELHYCDFSGAQFAYAPPVKITGPNGYEVWIQQRNEPVSGQA